ADEEILYYERETPHRKYGVGLLHSAGSAIASSVSPDRVAAASTDTQGIETAIDELSGDETIAGEPEISDMDEDALVEIADDFEVTSPDVRRPSTIGISFCVRLAEDGKII